MWISRNKRPKIMDANKIAKYLKIKERALADGLRNLPPVETRDKDQMSNDIDNILTEIISTESEKVHASSQGICRLIDSTKENLRNASTDLQRIENDTKARFYDLVSEGCNRLRQWSQRYSDARRFFNGFRKTHGLQRAPHDPQNPAWNWGVLIFIFSMEVAVNGFTLQDVHPEGFIGVITAMLLISFINICLGLTAGAGFRYTNHYQLHKRMFGWTSCLLLILALLFFNCLVGHWRNALVSTAADANFLDVGALLGLRLLDNFLDNPFLYSDFKSYLMVIAGFIFGCIAAWKGYSWTDPYPGYARVTMATNHCHRAYQYEMQRNREILKNIKDEILAQILNVCSNYDNHKHLLFDYRQQIKTIKQRYQDFAALAERIGEYLYQSYRHINMKRRGHEAPHCFGIKYILPAKFHDTTEIEEQAMQAKWVEQVDIRAFASRLEQNTSELYQKHLEIYNMFDSIDNADSNSPNTTNKRMRQIQNDIKPIQLPKASQ